MKQIDKYFRISIISGLISTVLIILTYIKRPEDPHFAGSVFAYNFSFFFPMLFLAFISGLISLIYLIKHRKWRKRQLDKTGKLKWLIPLILLIPVGLHIFLLIFNIIRIKFEINNYSNDYSFTSQRIDYNDSLKIYIHGAMFGNAQKERMVYVTDKPFTTENPDTNFCYYYKGDDRLFLFYKLENDTIRLYIPEGMAKNKNLMIDKIYHFEEIECNRTELKRLREDYNNGLIKQFYWSFYE